MLFFFLTSPTYAGEAYRILTDLPPLASVWHSPQMPAVPQEIYTQGENRLQSLGICWGRELSFFATTANSYSRGRKVYTFMYWDGRLHITVESDVGATRANHIWVDLNCDGTADEHYFGETGLANEYGKNAWFCHPLKRVLNYWR